MTMQTMVAYPSCTRRVDAPEGVVWVTSCLGGDHTLIIARAGKAGSTATSAAQSIGVLVTLAIRNGADPAAVALKLRGVSHDRQRTTEAMSIADAVGIALWEGIA